MLNDNELARYDRQIIMKGFGQEGQEKLKKAKVFVAGCGGLGSPNLVYLAAAGIGHIKVVDLDTIDVRTNRILERAYKEGGRFAFRCI